MAICRSFSVIQTTLCKAHCGVGNKTRMATMERRNGLFARELSLAVSSRQIETRRFELRNSTPRRVIVIRFHRTPTSETRSPSDIVARKVACPRQCVCLFKHSTNSCASRIYAKVQCIVINAIPCYTDMYYFIFIVI